jgi:hypothetical protein
MCRCRPRCGGAQQPPVARATPSAPSAQRERASTLPNPSPSLQEQAGVRLLIAVLTTVEAAAKRAAVRMSYGAVAEADPRVTVRFFLGQPRERDVERWIQALQVGPPGRAGQPSAGGSACSYMAGRCSAAPGSSGWLKERTCGCGECATHTCVCTGRSA